MTGTAHIFKELGRNLFRHPATAFGSFISLTLLLLLFELYWVTAATARQFYTQLLSDLTMEVFLTEEVPDSILPSLQTAIAAIDGVESFAYISKDIARAELSRLVGIDLLVGYDSTNPLPRSLRLTFSPSRLNTADISDIENKIANMSGVLQTGYSKEWLKKAESVRGLIWKGGVILGGVILLAAALTTIISIRLLTQVRAVGLRQMRLLGAGKFFLALPFLLEGLLIGGVSAGMGWLLISYGIHQVVFTQIAVVLPPIREIIFFCGAAALLGTGSGYLGIRHSLK